MRYLYLVIIIIFFSCKNEYKVYSDKDISEIVLIDSAENLFKMKEVQEYSQFKIIYAGIKKDSIKLNDTVNFKKYQDLSKGSHRLPREKDLKITVDTTKVIALRPTFPSFHSEKEFDKKYKAYPVFIENLSDDTLVIASRNDLRLHIQEKNNQEWLDMDKTFTHMCGVGAKLFLLPKNEIIITSSVIYDGFDNTKFRIMFNLSDTIYSNEFKMNLK